MIAVGTKVSIKLSGLIRWGKMTYTRLLPSNPGTRHQLPGKIGPREYIWKIEADLIKSWR